MATNQKQSSLLRYGFQDAVNPYRLPVFGPANLPVYGPQPKPQRPTKPKFGRPAKLAQPEQQLYFFATLNSSRPVLKALLAAATSIINIRLNF